MRLETLDMLNFKGYEEVRATFPARINVIVGRNGSGKTNLLDAIYYLSFTRSAFSTQDAPLIRHDQPFFMLKGVFSNGADTHTVTSSLQAGGRKVFTVDGQSYSKISEHIGRFPVILFAPDDVDLIREGGEEGRRFFDALISQIDRTYLDELIRYTHHVKQRNSLIRMAQEQGRAVDWVAMEVYDAAMTASGNYIHDRRRRFLSEFVPVFERFCAFIVSETEHYRLIYQSELFDKSFAEGLGASRARDLALQRTTFGIHRDDFVFQMGAYELKKLGSQGQLKSFVIAMRLAQHEILTKYKGFDPILLWDDIFDKLDDIRIGRLLELIGTKGGQLFITDARPDRTEGLLRNAGIDAALFQVQEGRLEVR